MLRAQLRSSAPAKALSASAASSAAPKIPPTRERIAGSLAAAALGALALMTLPAAAIASDASTTSTSTSPSTASTSASSSPYSSTSPYLDLDSHISYGLTRDGRIRACPGAIPNCVSTSSTTDLYTPALRAHAATLEKAAEALDAAVASIGGEKTFTSRGEQEGSLFLQYEVPGASPRVRNRGQPSKDVVEVLLRREKNSNGESSDDDVLVFYRSIADPSSIRYVPLIQQPVTDGGAQRARMRSLLVEKLGWRQIGCDVLDCFF